MSAVRSMKVSLTPQWTAFQALKPIGGVSARPFSRADAGAAEPSDARAANVRARQPEERPARVARNLRTDVLPLHFEGVASPGVAAYNEYVLTPAAGVREPLSGRGRSGRLGQLDPAKRRGVRGGDGKAGHSPGRTWSAGPADALATCRGHRPNGLAHRSTEASIMAKA